MNIMLKGTFADSLSLLRGVYEANKFDFSFMTAFADENPQSFFIIFDVAVVIPEGHLLATKYVAQFESDVAITEEQRNQLPVFKINAPAIAYPFLRSYVATILLNSGLSPIMLPTINFVDLAKQHEIPASSWNHKLNPNIYFYS